MTEANGPPARFTGGSRGFIVLLQLVYLALLFGTALLWFDFRNRLPGAIPHLFGPVPYGVLWFGALGAVLTSLSGVFDHATDWDEGHKYWHWCRPAVGASAALVAVLIFQGGVLAAGSQVSAGGSSTFLLYYVVAFLVGYREETFRELIKRVTDVILSPGTKASPPLITGVSPSDGPVAGSTPVVITGTSLTDAVSVKFGSLEAMFKTDSDVRITALSPAAAGAATVSLSIATRAGTAIGGSFTYASSTIGVPPGADASGSGNLTEPASPTLKPSDVSSLATLS
jgi:hypothetical protein